MQISRGVTYTILLSTEEAQALYADLPVGPDDNS